MTTWVVSEAMRILLRRRLSLGSAEVHTAQSHPIIGTPPLVPVPKNVTVNEAKTIGVMAL